MADGQQILAAGDVVDAPGTATEEAPPERDEQGRFTKQDAPERQAEQSPLGNGYSMPRDATPRFGDVAEHLAQAEYVKAVEAGHIPPDDSMDVNTWVAARKAQVARGTSAIEIPEQSPEDAGAPREQDGDGKATERDQEILNAYQGRRDTFMQQHPDFSEVVERIELPEHVARSVQLACLELPDGPAVAYHLGSHPELVQELSNLSPAAAASRVGGIAERLQQQGQAFDASARAHLGVEIPPAVVSEYQRKAIELQKHAGLTQEEIGTAHAVGVAPHVSHTIVAMGRPDIALHLVRNVGLVGRLNMMHPIAAAGEIAHLARELDSEAADNTGRRATVSAPIKPVRKPSPTSTGLDDSLPIQEWIRRREAQLREKR